MVTGCGGLTGCCSAGELLLELFELLELLELLELELLELFELLELLPEFEEFEFDEPLLLAAFELLAGACPVELDELDELDVPLPAELLVADACVEPGSTATTTPAATTEAKDTVIVVAFSRRRPCSRSATA